MCTTCLTMRSFPQRRTSKYGLPKFVIIAPADRIMIQLVELYMPKNDVPIALKLTAESSAKINAKE